MSLYVEEGYVNEEYTQDSVSINWGTSVIFVPKTFLTLIQSSPTEIYELNLNYFRLTLKELEDNPMGITYLKTHNHNTEVSLGGLTYARVIEILPPYTITFEDGQYAVNLVGANSNVGDRVNVNQVSVRSSNSAGLISIPSVEYSSFNGGVIIDTVKGTTGTVFPRGTLQLPVNNLDDALLICDYRGFNRLYLYSNLTISGNTAYNLESFFIQGQSHVKEEIIIGDIALVNSATFSDLTISGVLDGYNEINNSIVKDILYFNGHIHDSSLTGDILLAGNEDAVFVNCITSDFKNPPIVNMGGSGQNLVMTNYNGIISITNMSGATTQIGIGLVAGTIILDSTTVTGGVIHASGIGQLEDENGEKILTGIWNGGVQIINNLINTNTISEAVHIEIGTEIQYSVYNNMVLIDPINGATGTTYPIGTQMMPVKTLDDAILIANYRGFKTLKFLSDYTFISGTTLNRFRIYGTGMQQMTFTFQNGCDMSGCELHDATYSGNIINPASFINCRLENLTIDTLIPTITEVLCEFCIFQTEVKIGDNNNIILDVLNSWSFPDVITKNSPILNMNNTNSNVNLRNHSGGLKIINNSTPNEIRVYLNSGKIQLDSSITAGNFIFIGVGTLVNSATSVTSLDYDGLLSKDVVSIAVWDESLDSHVTAGSTGRALSLLQFNNKVWVDANSIYTGTTFPIGTPAYPVNNMNDAELIAINNGIKVYDVEGIFVLTHGYSGVTFTAHSGFLDDILDLNNQIYNDCIFIGIKLIGQMTGEDMIYRGCFIENVENISGEMFGGRLSGNISIEPGKILSGMELIIEGDNTTIDLQNQPCTVSLDVDSGYILYVNTVTGSLIEMNMKGGEVELDSSCVGGEYYFEGIGTLFNNSSMIKKDNHLLALETIPGPIWDEQLSGHTIAGSTGKALAMSSTGGVDYGILAEAVWAEVLSGTPVNDTAAFIMKQIAVLAEEIHKIHGLNAGNPVTVTQTSRIVDGINQTITTTGENATQETIISRN